MPDTKKKVLSVITTKSNRLSELEVSYGQLIFCQDKRTIYFDTDERIAYEQIILLIDENQRLGITPVPSFYFVEDTAILWRYDNDNGWRQLTTPPSEQIVFLNRIEFPPIGKDKVLYVSESAIYRWQNGEYTDISSIQWGDF